MTDEQKSNIKQWLRQKVDESTEFVRQKYEPKDVERDKRYNADPSYYKQKWPQQLNESEIVDTSVWNTTERIMASLMKVFFGTDEVGTIKGRTADDDTNAENMQELINWQVEYKCQGFLKFGQWFKDALVKCVGAIQITWKRETGDVEKTQSVPMQYASSILAEIESMDGVEVAMVEPDKNQPGMMLITVQYEDITVNEPVIENVPMSELFWSPSARNFIDSEIVGRRKKVTIDHLRRNIKRKAKDGTVIGMYEKKAVEEVAQGGDAGTDTPFDTQIKEDYNTDTTWGDKDPNREVEIFECYFKYDLNKDGLLEDVIATICGDVLLRCDANEDGLPFCLVSPVYDPHKVVPTRCSIDNIGQWQDFLTALYRLVLQNIDYNNNPQQAINPSKLRDVNQVIDRAQYIELADGVQSIEEAIQPVTQIPLAPYTLQLIDMIKAQIEEASAVSRLNQGIQANSLNKTATGMQLLVNQGAQSLELVARNMAETGVKDAFMRLVFLNQKYIDKDQVIRLINKDIVVNKDNLSGDFDYIVNSGMGAGARETDIQNMQQLLTMYQQFIPAGIATTENAYNAAKKLILAMGIKNVDDFLTDPQVLAQQQQPKGPDVKLSESLQVKFSDLPISAKVQICQDQGIQVTPQDFINDLAMQSQLKLQENAQQHRQNMEAAQINNAAKERMNIVGNIARASNQGATQQGATGTPASGPPGNSSGDMAGMPTGPGQGQGYPAGPPIP